MDPYKLQLFPPYLFWFVVVSKTVLHDYWASSNLLFNFTNDLSLYLSVSYLDGTWEIPRGLVRIIEAEY